MHIDNDPIPGLDDYKIYNTPTAAAFTGESPKTWEARRLKGTGPHYVKLGRSVRYLGKDIRAWIKANRRQSTSAKG